MSRRPSAPPPTRGRCGLGDSRRDFPREALADGCPLSREPTYDAEFQHFLRGKEIVLSAGSTPKVQGLTAEQAEAVVRLSCLPAFKDLIAKVQADEVRVL